MPRLSSQINVGNFTLTIPKDWDSNIDDELFTIFKSDNGVGAIQISSYSHDDRQFDLFDEFHELVTETLSVPLENEWAKSIMKIRDNFLVFETSVPTENKFFIIGFCEHNNSILFLTYNCSLTTETLNVRTFLTLYEKSSSTKLLGRLS